MLRLTQATSWAKSKLGWEDSGYFKIDTSIDEVARSNSETESTQAFPTILELAQLSQHVYTISDNVTKVPFKFFEMSDWICIGIGRYSDGYCGAAYVNHKHSHVVIAHGGTEIKIKKKMEFYRDFIRTDLGGIVLNKEVSQISTAYIFTKIIVNLCSDTLFSISVTGHSLGGWLAQICAFYIQHPKYISENKGVQKIIEDKQTKLGIRDYVLINAPYHLHTVSFDSPGCRDALKKIVGYYSRKLIEWRENVDTLDFTVLIAPSNIVNTRGEHVGYVLQLEMEGLAESSWIHESHSIQLFIEYLSSQNPKLKEVNTVYFWNAIQSEDKNIILNQWYVGRMYSCQVNIFSPKELKFLTRAQTILKWKNNESLDVSLRNIFKEEKHRGACQTLETIDFESLNDFILNFFVTHNFIECTTEKILHENDSDMSTSIWKLIKLLRLNRDWLNGSEFEHVIRDLPACRQMVCENEGSVYVERLPKLKDEKCTTEILCDKVEAFLGKEEEYFLHIRTGKEGRQSRLCMVHLFNCSKDFYKEGFGEHVLFINILSLQRLNWAFNMSNVFSQTKFGLIVVECDSEINKEMNDVITGMMTNSKSEKTKLIIVTRGQNCADLKKYPSHKCDVDIDLTLKFDNLDEKSKQIISQCQVDIHGNTMTLGKSDPPCGGQIYLLEDTGSFFNSISVELGSRIICDILDGKMIDLSGGSFPVMAEHYIPRTLFQITLDVGKFKERVKDFSDVLVVSNGEMSIQNLIPALIPLFEKNLIYEPEGYTKEFFLDDCESKFKSRNVHWFKMEESMLVWQISNGQPCFDYLRNDEVGGIKDSNMNELQNNFIILADEPGMGKSAAITKLFLEYRKKQFNSGDSHFNWPVYINLNNYQVELKDSNYSSDLAMSFLTKASNLRSDFEKSLFHFCLEKIGNLTFFVDSFDEISERGQNFVVGMLEHLKLMKHSRIRVWIATRIYAKYELEKRLDSKAYQFHRVEKEAQIAYLVKSWTQNVPHEQWCIARTENFAELFAKRAITEIRQVLGKDHTFIGIPLQLVLLAAIHNDKFLQLLENKMRDGIDGFALSLSDKEWKNSSVKFSSTLELYNLYVEKKLNIWLADKFKFETRTTWMENTLRDKITEIHSHAAFLYVSSSILTNSDTTMESLTPDDSNELNRVGFCERVVEWKKTMQIPKNVFKRIRKANRREREESLDIVLLTLRDTFPDRVTFHNKFQCVLNAEIKYGTETDILELSKLKSSSQIHYFKEVEEGSNLIWQYSFPPLHETTSTESVDVEISESNFRFHHQTIAEYFTAKYLENLIRNHTIPEVKGNVGVVSFLKNHYYQPYFKKIGYFLDNLLCTDIPGLENLELFNTKGSSSKIKFLSKCFTDIDWDRADALGRNLLHYALAYGDHKAGIIWVIAKDFELFHRKDLLGETCLSYLCLSEELSHSIFIDTLYTEEDTEEDDLSTQLIIELPVLYSIFCGSYCQMWPEDVTKNDIRLLLLSSINKPKTQPGFAGDNPAIFFDFLNTTDKNLLTKSLDINMKWLISQCEEGKLFLIESFLNRLCLHNSLDKSSGLCYLDDWFQTLLSDLVDKGRYRLGAGLIEICLGNKELKEYVLAILKNNLPKYYHNIYPYIDEDDEYLLWESCTDIDKRKMLMVTNKHNFYSLFRRYLFSDNPKLKPVVKFVYHEFADEFRDALNESLANAFHVFIFSDFHVPAFDIYRASDDQTKKRMIKENFFFHTHNSIHDEPELIDANEQTFKDIIDGKNKYWTLRPFQKIRDDDIRSYFFTLPVSADYPNDP